MKYRLLIIPVVAMLMMACSNDSEDGYDDGKVGVSFGMFTENLIETRAIPDNYPDASFSEVSNFGIIIPGEGEGNLIYTPAVGANPASWVSDVRLDPSNYKIYSYYPQQSPTKAALSNNNGNDVITLSEVPFCSDVDYLISSGTATSKSDLTMNSYSVQITTGSHYVYMMMDHLLARVNLNFTINSDYANIRTIEITNVKLNAANSSNSSYTTTCTFGASGITYQYAPTGDVHPASYLDVNYSGNVESITQSSGGTKALPLASSENRYFTTFYAMPSVASKLKLTVTYNVYDKKNVLVRSCMTATNSNLTITQSAAPVRGKSYELNVNVAPTYLYQLSDNDDDSVLLMNE